MYTDTDGIVIRQVKTAGGRRMILLFSRKYGKISAGTNLSERGKNKSALAIRPFTYARYELYKSRESCNINGAEVKKSFFGIGEDVDKFMLASYILEFTDKLLPEGQPNEKLFDLLLEFFSLLEERRGKMGTLACAYQVKAFVLLGIAPQLRNCVICGGDSDAAAFSIKDGGVICADCYNNMKNLPVNTNAGLIYPINFGIVNILKYFAENPLSSLRKIGLEEDVQKQISELLAAYAEYHLDIKELKSKEFI